VTQPDIERVFRPLTGDEAATVAGRSDSAWIRILARVPDIETRITVVPPATAAVLSEAVVKDVMVSMIVRVLKNPESARTRSESIDDHSDSITLDTSVSTGELYLSDAEYALLVPAVAPVYGMYVVRLGG
jgi:hypothetical protein